MGLEGRYDTIRAGEHGPLSDGRAVGGNHLGCAGEITTELVQENGRLRWVRLLIKAEPAARVNIRQDAALVGGAQVHQVTQFSKTRKPIESVG